ncbi:uncharacterized protein LOC129347292 [Amphiprion ocellaris]|uniref:uncharacterized protein LOC129347292 n=1 Tax=Amphiprion ocellaris TaxID=80972 RepID=UPI0024118EB1|nr:uncharacterized protein LOC129347292 [Amphiprion ocellaris]
MDAKPEASKSDKGSKTAKSSRSSTSSTAIQARAQAEAAKARASYADTEAKLKVESAAKEAELQLSKAKLDAELKALEYKREAAAAIAQAEALEAAEELESDKSDSIARENLEKDIKTRTQEYVEKQAHLQSQPNQATAASQFTGPDSDGSFVTWHAPSPKDVHAQTSENNAQENAAFSDNDLKRCSHANNYDGQNGPQAKPKSTQYAHGFSLNAAAPSYVPRGMGPPISTTSDTEHLACYLARRNLISTSLYPFDDKPESYRAWQSSFVNTTEGVGLTATETLDLLVKWLGTESAKHVKRIRSVHAGNPNVALEKAWARLQECYAAPEVTEKALFKRLDNFPKVSAKDYSKLRDLGDLLMEIQGAKEEGYLKGLSYLDTARGIGPIIEKLPYGIQDKWLTVGSRYKEEYKGQFPPFDYFTSFICNEACRRNDPSFLFSRSHERQHEALSRSFGNKISVHKTEVSTGANQPTNPQVMHLKGLEKNCLIHNKAHPLRKCRAFRAKSIEERKTILKQSGICFKCCAATSHLAKDCKAQVKCSECNSDHHDTAMHISVPPQGSTRPAPPARDGGEEEQTDIDTAVSSQCTQVCGPGLTGRSCSKICLVRVYHQGQRGKAANMYAILDDQSNCSLVRSDFFELFNVKSPLFPYKLKTCAGPLETSGHKAEGFQIESLDGKRVLSLPPLIECNEIPNDRSEIPTPDAARCHSHLEKIAQYIPELDPNAEILILLGRDILRVHKVRQQVNGPHNAPFAQKLDLGWVLIGDVCLGNAHKPTVSSYRTNVLENGRPFICTPCNSSIKVIENTCQGGDQISKFRNKSLETLGQNVFNETASDNKLGPSIEDTIFLQLMDTEMFRDDSKHWVAPLPFRPQRQRLPNNREYALSRLYSLQKTLRRKPKVKDQFLEFMNKIFQNNHAEVAPPLLENEECWYLPTFGVFHPQKPHNISVVFDSSAKHSGMSLNDTLLKGPDLNNSLVGVLIRFRKEQVAILADIQQMFHCFLVCSDHRNYLRFLWHKDNDMSKEIINYRMRVHVFGNSPSPSVAIYGLRRAIKEGAHKHGADTVKFVERHFYVDDGLISVSTDNKAISLLQRTQASLSESNLRLHKFASNSSAVLQAFAPEDRAVLKDLDLSDEATPVQRSLGLIWVTTADTFTFKASEDKKLFTRRGVLSTVNSIFDPLGMLAPVTIEGKHLLREFCADKCDWDAPLPEGKLKQWELWRDSLQDLNKLHIPRAYTPTSLSKAEHKELCVFSDASVKAIGAVAYLRTIQAEGQVNVGFILGKAKLAPLSQPTIPRLELCAAVLAVEVADLIQDELDLKLDSVKFFCDSKVVLGYIHNRTKRFHVYVHNRVQRIHQSTKPNQWFYVRTDDNPADHASRSVPAAYLSQTTWFTGPAFLHKPKLGPENTSETFELVNPETDTEIRAEVSSYLTQTQEKCFATRFQRFSSMHSLTRAIATLIHAIKTYKQNKSDTHKVVQQCKLPCTSDELAQARHVIIKAAQEEFFSQEMVALASNQPVPRNSALQKLNPVLKEDLIWVGGRLKHAQINATEWNPIILPKNSHISLLLVRQYHEQVKHQGRHFTEGALRAAGYWIIGGKRLIASVLHKCVTCRQLCRKVEQQLMADLPPERLQVSPPFTYVGVDVFGPWPVISRRTRGSHAENKRWAMLFCCMSSRAVHIEVIASLDTSSCINALRRFFAIRGPVKQIRSDCGTNFVAAAKELGLSQKNPNVSMQKFLSEQNCEWVFNPPHASHMGGSWERLIGLSRCILDAILLKDNIQLTHDVLCTLMMEVSAIINARPLVPVPNNPDSPSILCPAMILTQKVGVPPPQGEFTNKDLYSKQWRQVQAFADEFWRRWR